MKNPILSLLLFLFFSFSATSRANAQTLGDDKAVPLRVRVGVVLNRNCSLGKTSNTTIKMAVSDFYAVHPAYATRLDLRFRDSDKDIISSASAVVDLIKNEQVHAIIGPQTSGQADFAADIADKSQVPVISFSATSPTISPKYTPYFIRTAVSDCTQARFIADLIRHFGWKQVVPIYENTEYGTGVIPFLIDAIKEVGGRVPYRSVLPPQADDDYIRAELYKLRSMQTRVFVVHMTRPLDLRLFALAAEAEMMEEGYAWIMTNGLTSLMGTAGSPETVFVPMQGVLGVNPYVPRTDMLRKFQKRWRREFLEDDPDADMTELSIYGLWAYDTVWALAMAIESARLTTTTTTVTPTRGSTDLATLGISTTGPKLLNSILDTKFTGLTGEFNLTNGQLSSPVFEVINVNDEKEVPVGYWNESHGLWRQPPGPTSKSVPGRGLRPVTWPGETAAVPKGWVQISEGKKLRILVPGLVEPGFQSLLKVDHNRDTNKTVVGGFVVEVFEAAVKELPYAILYEYVTTWTPDGKNSMTYDDLVYQVYLQNYDAFVGDVTITANRSQYVDFTMPFTTSGVSMVVPNRVDLRKNAWIFLRPLTKNLWIVSAAFFVFTGIVVWLIEHRINPEFRGEPTNQLGTIFYFTFSTLVFAHREKMLSNLSRVVVVIWLFVVLILQSSYTASLTSMLTVQRFQATVAEIEDLKTSGEYVGYLRSSFMKEQLESMGFDKSKLKPYKSLQQYADGLALGSKNGGVGAIVDEIPYLKMFLKDYCSNHTMTGRALKTGGFGFVFPKGSPLVSDLSQAILNTTEGDKMLDIEKRGFGDQTTCLKDENPISANRLSFSSFVGLFLITGVTSVTCFIVYVISFIYKKRQLLTKDEDDSVGKKLKTMAREFDQKDTQCRTFRGSPVNTRHSMHSPCTNGSQTPFSISHRTPGGDRTPTTVMDSPARMGTDSPFSIAIQGQGGGTPPNERNPSSIHQSTGENSCGGAPP